MKMVKLGEINNYVGKNINPLNLPEEIFEMYSVPSFNNKYPEIIKGKDIGSSKQLVQKDDILICKINPRINRVWIVSEFTENKHIASSEWIVVRNKDMYPRYLMWYFRSDYFRSLMVSNITGMGGSLMRAQPNQVKEYLVPITDYDNQIRIAEVLDKAQELIDKRKAQIEALDELVKSQFIEMFGDPVLNPKNWPVKSFNEVFNISSSSRILKSEWKTEGTIPFYRVRDMVCLSESGISNNEFFVSEEFYESLSNEKGTPQYGDIMVSATSTIGKCYIVKPGEKFYYKDADVLRFRKKVELASEYFVQFMKTSFAINQIERTFGITTVPHFTIVNSKKINMIYPPIELQNQFADFVKQVDKLKFEMQESLKELENNFNSLMQRAFKGELFN